MTQHSPVPELSFLPAPYRGWTRAGERRVQDNLHAHAQNEPIKNYQVPTTLLASMCRAMVRAMPFSARALKENIFVDVDIVIKKHKNVNIEIWFIVVCTLIDNEYASLLFSQTFFSYCFCLLSDFAKVFERKVWRVQVAHLHNAARALSFKSKSVFSIVNKSWQRFLSLSLIMWYKKQIECGLAWHWWNSTDLGLIDMVLINLNAEIVACIYYHSENRATSQIWKNTSKYGFSPDLGGKNGGVLSMRMQVILDSSFARPGSAPIWGGKKVEFRDWTRHNKVYER